MINHRYLLFFPVLFSLLAACTANKSVMFKTDKNFDTKAVSDSIRKVERSYVIRKNDYIEVLVYTNSGERIIDPNNDFGSISSDKAQTEVKPRFLVRPDGKAKLPMIGEIQLEGLTISQADSLLADRYSNFYEDVFVIIRPVNRRVVVFGPQGGKVIALENEDMNLIEVLALYGAITEESKVHNIRLIRGELNDPTVQVINLSTIEGMKEASLSVKTNDIVYIERKRKLFLESIRDVAPLIAIIGNIITIVFVISR